MIPLYDVAIVIDGEKKRLGTASLNVKDQLGLAFDNFERMTKGSKYEPKTGYNKSEFVETIMREYFRNPEKKKKGHKIYTQDNEFVCSMVSER